MASIGINVPADGSVSPADLRRLGATWIRVVATPEHDLRVYLTDLRQAGIRTLLVLARESGGDIIRYARMYGSLVAAWQVANEPDGTGESSWSMTPHEFVSLGRTVRAILPDAIIVAGGLVSGQPFYLDGLDMAWADLIAPHPYGKSPDPAWPHPGWGTGYLGDLLDGYAAFGKPLFISEIGLSTHEVSEEFQAEYLTRVFDYVNSRPDVVAMCWFCWSDRMV